MKNMERAFFRVQLQSLVVSLGLLGSCAEEFTGVEIASMRPKVQGKGKESQLQNPEYPLSLDVVGLNKNQCTVKYSGIPLQVIGNFQILGIRADVGSVFNITVKTDDERVEMKTPEIKDLSTCLSEVMPDVSSYAFKADLTVKSSCKDIEWSITEDAPACNIKIVVKPL